VKLKNLYVKGVLLASLILVPWPWPDTIPTEPYLPWATGRWIIFAASIVAGEAADTDEARQVTACTLVHDVERGWYPWVLRDRWFGWASPSKEALTAMVLATTTNICREYPRCSYVGSFEDLKYWRRTGVADSSGVWVWMDAKGKTTVCIPERREQ